MMADDVIVSQKPCRQVRRPAHDVAILHNTSHDSRESFNCYAQRVPPSFMHSLDVVSNLTRNPERGSGHPHWQTFDEMHLDASCCRSSTQSRTVLRVNYCLMVTCVLVLGAYVLTILNLHKVFQWPHQKTVHSESQPAAFHGDFPFCVQRGTWLDNFTQDFDHRRKHSGSGEQIVCFSSLDWIPAIAERVLRLLNVTVSHGASSSAGHRSLQIRGQQHPFAHLLADLRHPHTGQSTRDNGSGAIKWRAPDNTSHLNFVQLNTEKDSLTVTQSGYYFIYSHLDFDASASSLRTLCVYKNYRDGQGTILMRSNQQETKSIQSFAQGVVSLVENDTISVVVQTDSSDLANMRNTYIGLFLL